MAFIQAMTRGTFSREIPFSVCKQPLIHPHNFLHGFCCPLKFSQPPKHEWKPSLHCKLKYSSIDQVLRLLVQNVFLKEKKTKTKTKETKPKSKKQTTKQDRLIDEFRSQVFPLFLHPVRKYNKKIIFRVAEYSCLQSQDEKSQDPGKKPKPWKKIGKK